VKARINVRLKKLQIATKHALITYRTAYGGERLWLCSAFEKGREAALIMGCGGSKEAANEPGIPMQPVRASTARPRTSNRPPTSQNRPASKRPPSSQRPSSSKRPSSSSARPPTGSKRPSSSQRPSSSSRRTGSAQGGRTRPKSSYQGQPTIYEDHVPEDNDITQGIIVLCTLIDQHAERFYAAQYSPYVRRTIGEALANHISVGDSNGTAPHIPSH